MTRHSSGSGHYQRAEDLAGQAETIQARIGAAEPDLADLAELELTLAKAQVHATLAVADEIAAACRTRWPIGDPGE